MTPSQSHLSLLLLLLLALAGDVVTAGQPELADCPGKCGNISIPFPFGMKPGCFLPGFEVNCNTTFNPPRAFLKVYNGSEPDIMQEEGYRLNGDGKVYDYSTVPLQLMDISASKSEARVYLAVTSLCFTSLNSSKMTFQSTYLKGPFLPSATRNALLGIGYQIAASLGESLFFPTSSYKISCSGLNFCQASMSGAGVTQLSWFGARLDVPEDFNTAWETSPCYYAMVVDRSWYNFSIDDTHGYKPNRFIRGVPIVVDFAIRNASSCPGKGQQPPPGYACVSGNSSCTNATNGEGYVCKCLDNYDGNPYISNGCQDINECELPELYPCSNGICKNRVGGYDCPCKYGMKGDGKTGTCKDIVGGLVQIVAIPVSISIIILLVLFIVIKHYQKKWKIARILEVTNMLAFSFREISRATGNFGDERLLGEGGFGKVYKGTFRVSGSDQHLAVKCVTDNDSARKQLLDELMMLGDLHHKNVVKLKGFCSNDGWFNFGKRGWGVYVCNEFFSKGSLDRHISVPTNNTQEPLAWEIRYQIIHGICAGLQYLHEQCNETIAHMDLKPNNILLDQQMVPKIADFGLSTAFVNAKTHTYTTTTIGTNGYMAPELTERNEDMSFKVGRKCDIYSLGVLILAIVMGHGPVAMRDPGGVVFIRKVREKFSPPIDWKKLKRDAPWLDDDCLDNVKMCVELAFECVVDDPDRRPLATELYSRLPAPAAGTRVHDTLQVDC